jgi:hypothetical protein
MHYNRSEIPILENMKILDWIPLRIHCWGGLGSQLYALSTLHDLQMKYPRRKIKLLLHTSGVTKRDSELDFIENPDFEIIQINDFQIKDFLHQSKVESIKIKLKHLFSKFLYFVNIVVPANSNTFFKHVYPWTVSIRGHYFNREVPSHFYEYLLKHIKLDNELRATSQFEIAIHYRLGDLLTLIEKSISPANKIIDVVRQFQKSHDNLEILVYSDSPQIARETLRQGGFVEDFSVRDLSTINVIRACVGADYFIGTGSKVSLWIVNLRRFIGKVNDNHLEGFDDKLYAGPKTISSY